VPHCVPDVSDVEPQHPHALILRPVRLLMPDECRLVDALGQDEHAPRRQRDAAVAEGPQEPADDVGRGALGHYVRQYIKNAGDLHTENKLSLPIQRR